MISYDINNTALASSTMELYGYDLYNEPGLMDISISVDFSPIANTVGKNMSAVFVAQQDSFIEIGGDLFTDEDMLTLTFTAELDDGSSLPSWLTFEYPASPPAGVFNFSGADPLYVEKTLDIHIFAEDENGLTVYTEFEIKVDATCHIA